MKLKKLPYSLTVAKYDRLPKIPAGFSSLSVAEGEVSLVCESTRLPQGYVKREDGWRAFMVQGPLDFSLVGILSRLSSILAERGIPIFVLSTFDTDYLLVKEEFFTKAVEAFLQSGVSVE